MPGGKIGFNVGMFPYAPTDDDIAVILGHEVAHVICRHGAERVSQQLGVAAAVALTDEATKNKDAKTRQAWVTAIGLGSQLGVLLPYSRGHESEADHLGLLSWLAPATTRRKRLGSGSASRRSAGPGRRSSFRRTRPTPSASSSSSPG